MASATNPLFPTDQEHFVDIPITEELVGLLKKIKTEGKSLEEWAEIESDDMFQSGRFVGGYDADEAAFCFSYFDIDGGEYWFQFTLSDVDDLLVGKKRFLIGRPAER